MKKVFAIIYILCLCFIAQASDEYMVRHWGVENGLSQNTISCILQDHEGYMWFGTWDGLNRFDGQNFRQFRPENAGKINTRIEELYEDEHANLWFSTYDGHYYRLDSTRTQTTSHSEQEIPDALRIKIEHRNDTLRVDKNGIVWLLDNNPGILRYRNGSWKRLVPQQDMRFKGQARRHFILLEDAQGRTWVNPTGGGFSYYDKEKDELICPLRSTSTIHEAYVDREGLMWLATFDKGIDCLNWEEQPFRVHDLSVWQKSNGEIRAMTIRKNGELELVEKDERMIYCVAETQWGLLYGTRGNGIIGGTRHFELSNNDVYDILEYDDLLMVATFGGGINVFRGQEHFVLGEGLKVRCLAMHNGELWAGTTQGIMHISKDSTYHFIPANDVRSLCSAEGNLYVGTFGGGLFTVQDYTLIPIETGDHIIQSIVCKDSMLYCCSETYITQLNLHTGEHQNFRALEETRKAYFSESKGLVTNDGKVLFGYSQGYIEFDPNKVHHSTYVPPIKFLSITAMGEEIAETDNIKLAHDKGALWVDYVALDYVEPNNIDYAYRLDGLDTDWHEVGTQRYANYANLPSGRYTLRVRSTNREGVWQDNEQTIHIIVAQNPWFSWWAWLIYLALAFGLVMLGKYGLETYQKLQQQLLIEEEVNNIKIQFFTNISHELRTPLTLITGPIANILHNEKLSTNVRSQLEIVSSNAARMLRMVNQILDFRKVQNGKMRLRIQRTTLRKIVEQTTANFHKEAMDKRIAFSVKYLTENDEVWVDCDKIDTILYNLLSNAFKYTQAGLNKAIEVRVEERSDYVLLIVADEGMGIPKDKRNIIFSRYNSHNEVRNLGNQPGTGIGLNLVKDLVDLHGGFIEVESTPGKGSTFTVMLRKGNEHFTSDVDMIVDDHSDSKVVNNTTKMQELEDSEEHRTNKQVMIVDDNDDMREFLKTILGNDWDIITARDGADALQQIHHSLPDLVITDLMMPNMDGMELTKRLKTNIETSFLPIILLTAKSAIESRLEAMEGGADDYVTKPFEPEYLRARVRNILTQRDKLEHAYRERLMRLEPENTQSETPEDTFLARLMSIMNKHMDNNELTVDMLVEEMGLGRTVFFNRLKGMTGMSPVEFIREIRIKRAAQLLEQGKYNVSEVTYMVGMNDSRYFSKCFKATYGVTPSEYKKSLEKKD